VPVRKVRFLVGWVEPRLRRGYVGLSAGFTSCRTSTQPTKIKQIPKYGFSKRNPTNHVAGVLGQALIMEIDQGVGWVERSETQQI